MSLWGLVAGCDRGPEKTEPRDDSADGARRVPCEAWELRQAQRFEQADFFGDAELPDLRQEQGPGVAMGDLDLDGDLDLFYVVSDGRSFVLTNDGAGAFTLDDSWTVDGAFPPPATSVGLSDLDADGDLDAVLTTTRGRDDLVLTNLGGRFTATALPDSEGEHLSPTLADFDGDGDVDLAAAGFVDYIDGDNVGPETVGDGQKLWLREGAEWTDATDRLPPEHLDTVAYQLGALDADGDLAPDLFISADFGLETGNPSQLLRNVDGSFIAAPESGASSQISAMGIAPGDYNQDGLLDFFVSNWGKQILYQNIGGGVFVDGALDARVREPQSEDSVIAWGARFADLDLDGDEDLVVTFGPPNDHIDRVSQEQGDVLWFNDGAGRYTDRTAGHAFDDPGIGRGVAVGDLDGNGRPDIVVTGRVYLLVWLASGGCPGPIRLKLEGPPGNPEAIGARVDVRSPFADYSRWVWPAGLYGQSATDLRLGLSGGTTAELTVTWPDGTSSETVSVAAEDELVIPW